jgi:hypothetical protein
MGATHAQRVSAWNRMPRRADLLIAAAAGLARDGLSAAAAVPQAHELTGQWHVTAGSRSRLLVFSPFRRFGDEEHLIVLNTQGSCRFRSHWQYSYIDANETEGMHTSTPVIANGASERRGYVGAVYSLMNRRSH